MTGRTAADHLVNRGLDPAEHAAKQRLFDRALDACRSFGDPYSVAWVPGRLEVFGKHTDYAGGRTLVAAVPRGFAMAARTRDDGLVRVVDAIRAQSVTLDPQAPGPPESGWRNYTAVVVRRLARNFPGAALGADVVLASDLPSAAGMSSSSALVVGVATALVRVAGLESRAEWRSNITGDLDAAGYYACLENGMTFGTLEGDGGVGTHGGSEDHAAIVSGRAGHVSAFRFVPMRRIGDAGLPRDWRFVLAPSGVRAAKTGNAMAAYNRLSRGARVLSDLIDGSRSLAAALSDADAVEEVRRRIAVVTVDGWTSSALTDRLEHFLREDARIEMALRAFASADRDALSGLSEASQSDAETLLGNQVPETIALARSARAFGALASSSFGAGFGGSVWALVDAAEAGRFAARWHPEAFVARPAPGVTHMGSE